MLNTAKIKLLFDSLYLLLLFNLIIFIRPADMQLCSCFMGALSLGQAV